MKKIIVVKIVLLLNLVFLEGIVFAEEAAPPAMPAAAVRVLEVEERSVQQRQKAIGTLRAVSESEVAAREEGAILSVLVNEGQLVKQGDILVELDRRRLDAQLKEAKAAMATANSLIEQRQVESQRVEVDYEMKEGLYKQKAVSLRDFLDAEREKKVAVARLQSAKGSVEEIKSRIELLRVRLEDMTIKAPFNGSVIARHVEPGEWLTPGTAVVTMISSGAIEAWINLSERLVQATFESNDFLEIEVDALKKRFKSESIKMIHQVDTRSRTLKLIVQIKDRAALLSPGMSVTTWVPVGKQMTGLVVPDDALIRNQFGSFVFKAQPADKGHMAMQVPVQILFTFGGEAVIETDQVKAGDFIIVEGNERIFPNSPIEITKMKAKK